jgi:transcriptional repressor NrdR
MRCPVCSASDTRVVDSRAIDEGTKIRRRRSCDECGHRFTTFERAEGVFPMVIKKDGRREPWNPDKLLKGISRACNKRPVSVAQIDNIINNIEHSVGGLGVAEISANDIGELVMKALKDLDEVAYVRFASVYRSFKDIDEFMAELSNLVKKRKTKN